MDSVHKTSIFHPQPDERGIEMPKHQLSEERNRYWASVVDNISHILWEKQFLFPEVQASFNGNVDRIKSLYPHHQSVPPKLMYSRRSLDPFNDGNLAPLAARLDEGHLSLWGFMPDIDLMDRAIRAEKHDPDKVDFIAKLSIAIKFNHEYDHMGLGVVGEGVTDIVNGEKRVWAKTCQESLCPLVEVHGQKLCFSDQLFYDQWNDCNRDAESQKWEDFVAKLYGKQKKG